MLWRAGCNRPIIRQTPLRPTDTLGAMNFGFRLPGPFRVNVSSKGKVYGGMTVGPFSVSGPLGGQSSTQAPQVWALTLDEAVAIAESTGWRVTGRWDHVATLRRRMTYAQIRAVDGGVTMYRSTSDAVALIGVGLFVLLLGWCFVSALLR